ncbi:MAG TPA: hypothetical protein VK625_08385, partial [Flavitalea sp.]|nr:hypothetical protein [Flavitalea sp.]
YLIPIINSDSSNLRVLAYLGYAFYMNEDYPAAENYFRKIVNIDSNNVPAKTTKTPFFRVRGGFCKYSIGYYSRLLY